MYSRFQSHLQNQLKDIESAGLYKKERVAASRKNSLFLEPKRSFTLFINIKS